MQTHYQGFEEILLTATTTKKPLSTIIWEAKGASEEKLKRGNKFEQGLGIGRAEGNGKNDGARRQWGGKAKAAKPPA